MAGTVKNTGPTRRRVDPKVVAKALGADRAGMRTETRRGPISLFALRQFLVDRLRSSGGRPALVGTTGRRSKIPLFAGDWDKLEEIARYYRERERINVTPGQIASALIHTNISRMDTSRLASLLED